MTPDDDIEGFIKEIAEIMEGWGSQPDQRTIPLIEGGLTSLNAAEIGALLEFRYNVIFPLESFLDDKLSIADLIAMIEASDDRGAFSVSNLTEAKLP